MGHHRPLRSADSAVPRFGRSAIDSPKCHASQLRVSVHTLPLVLNLRHRIPLVLP